MRRLFLTLILLVASIVATTAQNYPVDTARINKAYKVLMSGERTTETEMEFLEAFPTTWLEFYMTYSCLYNEARSYSMCNMCSEHLTTLVCLSYINDTVKCKKIVNLTIGMKETGESTRFYQDFLIGYVLRNDKLVLDYLSTLRKGHQMQFWQFCWSTATECGRLDDFLELYNRNRLMYPKQMEMSRIAFEYFYDGINYPRLLPHNEEEYNRKYDRNYRCDFDDHRDSYLE